MKCPACRVPTYAVEYDKIELDLCPDCEGIWFDAGELTLLLDEAEDTPLTAAVTSEEERPCPLCDGMMSKVNIGPGKRVMIDTCPSGCGLWFDQHELQELTNDMTAGGWQVQPRVLAFLKDMFPAKGE